MNFDIETTLEKFGSAAVAYDVQFQGGVQVVNTLHFQNAAEPDVHLYIGIDAKNTPVCMSLVHPPSASVLYQKIPTKTVQATEAALELFGFASAMAAAHSQVAGHDRQSARYTSRAENLFAPAARRMRDMELAACA